MVYFKNPEKSVNVPESTDYIVLPDWSIVYGRVLTPFDYERKKDEIQKKLFLIGQYEDKVENFFFTLGLLERFSIKQKDPQYMFSPESYEKYNQRARRLMSIFNCVTEDFLEEESLCKAFLYGVVDHYKVFHKIFGW